MTPADDAWNPFDDPEGDSALKSPPQAPPDDPLAKKLRPDEQRILAAARAGQPLRDVEIDHLVRLGLARRDKNGELQLLGPPQAP